MYEKQTREKYRTVKSMGQRKNTGNRRRRKRKRQKRMVRAAAILISLIAIFGGIAVYNKGSIARNGKPDKVIEERPELDVELLTINPYSRPGTALEKVNGIVVHYTANPGSGAIQNRNYFEGLKDSQTTYASSHFIIGLDGEIVQCIPCSEIAYASNKRNSDTISIECCIPDETGKFNPATYDALVELTSWLCTRYGITSDAVIRHYDVTGKLCPKYYVEHEDAWEQFKKDIDAYVEENGV